MNGGKSQEPGFNVVVSLKKKLLKRLQQVHFGSPNYPQSAAWYLGDVLSWQQQWYKLVSGRRSSCDTEEPPELYRADDQ